MMHPDDTVRCFQSHMGLWAVKPAWMEMALHMVQLGAWSPQVPIAQPTVDAASRREQLFANAPGGVAVISIEGQVTKYPSKFGGTSAIVVRQALRQALADEQIGSIMLFIDSPGGQVAGINDLAIAIRQAQNKKPVAAYIEDLGASAAYWLASQAQRIMATPTTEVGSIGVFAVLQDMSGLAERSGITVRVVSTGPYKGQGVPGTPITDAMVDDVQKHVDEIGTFFFGAVKQGRRFTNQQLSAVTDGRVWLAKEAQSLGLVDDIGSFDEALAMTAQLRLRRRTEQDARTAQLRTRQELLHGSSQ